MHQANSENKPKTSVQQDRPLDFGITRGSNRTARIRLFIMVASLLAVVWLMSEARKPENWRWMGFDGQAPAENGVNAFDKMGPPAEDNNAGESIRFFELKRPAKQDIESGSNDSTDRGAKLREGPQPFDVLESTDQEDASFDRLDPTIQRVRQDFWNRAFKTLDVKARDMLFRLVRMGRMRQSDETELSGDEQESGNELLVRLDQLHQDYAGWILGQSGKLDSSNRKLQQQWYDILFRLQNIWRSESTQTLKRLVSKSFDEKSDDEIVTDGLVDSDKSDDQILIELQSLLDVAAARQVKDRTAIGRPVEAPYWNRLLEMTASDIATEHANGDAMPVSFLQLVNQPKSFRGKHVSIAGRVRAGRKLERIRDDLGIDHYFELWVQTDDGATVPLCVYAIDLPDNFPDLEGKRRKLDIHARFTGRFFKVRSFLNSEDNTQFYPVVVCAIPALKTKSATNPESLPSVPIITVTTIVLVVIAAMIAFFVYRSSRTSGHRPRESDDLGSMLDGLKTDRTIQTELQRIQMLNQKNRGIEGE